MRAPILYMSSVTSRILGNTNKITLRLKVASPTGILLWSGGDHFSAASDYLLLGVKDGYLQFRSVCFGIMLLMMSRFLCVQCHS